MELCDVGLISSCAFKRQTGKKKKTGLGKLGCVQRAGAAAAAASDVKRFPNCWRLREKPIHHAFLLACCRRNENTLSHYPPDKKQQQDRYFPNPIQTIANRKKGEGTKT